MGTPGEGPGLATLDEPETSSRRERRRLRKELAKSERARDKAQDKAQSTARSEIGEQLGGLVRALHPRQALLTGLVVAVAAYVAGRPVREVAFAGGAVLLVQAVLGLVNDVGDATSDEHTGRQRKPVAEGHLPASNARFAAACLLIVAVPVSLQNGWAAALYLLAYLVVALLARTPLRRSVVSWLPWAVSFALLPAFLSYAGPGAGLHGGPPTTQITAAAAVLGVGVHFLLSLPDLVADNKAGVRNLPLRIALRIGATRLLVLSLLVTLAAILWLGYAAATVGLQQ